MIRNLLFLFLLFFSFSVLADEDPWKAVYVFQSKLAEQGNIEAQYRLGKMYEEGLGTSKNYKFARIWYQKAANKGHSAATFKLGTLYEKGLGVTANKRKAMRLYEEAANNGNLDARARLEKWSRKKASADEQLENKDVSSDEKRLAEQEEARKAAEAKQRAEEEKAHQAALAKKRAEEEKARKAALAKKRAEEEKARQAALAKKRAEQEKARKAALAKKQAKKELKNKQAKPSNPTPDTATVSASGTQQGDTASSDSNSKPLDKTVKGPNGGKDSFETDPCKSPAARFMSTCRGK